MFNFNFHEWTFFPTQTTRVRRERARASSAHKVITQETQVNRREKSVRFHRFVQPTTAFDAGECKAKRVSSAVELSRSECKGVSARKNIPFLPKKNTQHKNCRRSTKKITFVALFRVKINLIAFSRTKKYREEALKFFIFASSSSTSSDHVVARLMNEKKWDSSPTHLPALQASPSRKIYIIRTRRGKERREHKRRNEIDRCCCWMETGNIYDYRSAALDALAHLSFSRLFPKSTEKHFIERWSQPARISGGREQSINISRMFLISCRCQQPLDSSSLFRHRTHVGVRPVEWKSSIRSFVDWPQVVVSRAADVDCWLSQTAHITTRWLIENTFIDTYMWES